MYTITFGTNYHMHEGGQTGFWGWMRGCHVSCYNMIDKDIYLVLLIFNISTLLNNLIN